MNSKKKFGLISIVLLGINAIIGSGIFLLPGKAYTIMGTSSLFVYLFITLLAGSMAFCFAEVAGLFKSNGGAYIYTKEAFGNFAGFEVGFMKYVVQITAWATMTVGFVTALSAIFPCALEGTTKNIIVITMILGLSLINLFGVDIAKYVNNIATIGKLIPLILFIGVGIFFVKGGNYHPVIPAQGITISNFSNAAILVFYAFTGFEAISTASEDMEDSKKNLPIAIIISICCVAVIYFLIQFVCIGTLGQKLSSSETPVVTAMAAFLGSAGGLIVTIGTLISIGGINIAASFLTPRGCLALSERGMLPPAVAKKSRWGTPAFAICITALITIPVALSGSFVQLAIISTITRFSQYIPTCLAVIVFRRRGLKSTFQIPFGYFLPLLATGVSIWLLANADRRKLKIGLGAMIFIIPIYFIMKWYNKKHGYQFSNAE